GRWGGAWRLGGSVVGWGGGGPPRGWAGGGGRGGGGGGGGRGPPRRTMTSFDFDVPDHFTAGMVGPQGERVFYIQGRQRGRLATLKSEKEQVRALATYLAQLLDKLPTASETTPQSLD